MHLEGSGQQRNSRVAVDFTPKYEFRQTCKDGKAGMGHAHLHAHAYLVAEYVSDVGDGLATGFDKASVQSLRGNGRVDRVAN